MADTSMVNEYKQLNIAFKDVTQKIDLPLINNGVDSFEYRFWLNGGSGSGDLINLIRIRFDSAAWIISETLIWSHIPEYEYKKGDTVNHLLETVVDSTKTRIITPLISISAFIDSLQQHNLEQAPLSLDIKKSFAQHMDGNGQTIELADKHQYRKIFYTCPITITGLQDFHQSMKSLFLFLQRNLKIKFVPC
ncbi:MAG: hypothetical protein EOP53_18940 [Sphingobacteriales bacterium]|nr:MAG: hypothetical protein EOP53_18940 [Sphingobacteriales bacterium]